MAEDDGLPPRRRLTAARQRPGSAVRTQLLRAGIPARNIRYEVFGPDLWLAAHAEG
ncbi:hypothetical protein ACFOZ0_03765 [Streptomyces yaanensis]|uniref:Uncharacterized protein n=1 Tax=Streptomyces yaanensis TaxID=1142239 RepID=A0ABV7S698_9ACTN|nr:hypothetical protein [Streptomyces sp. CGMCC 4.7035]WNC03357.1 hypothetical protein Q2K21_18980 [Streptomyces sp. CGMCC 4.7035]